MTTDALRPCPVCAGRRVERLYTQRFVVEEDHPLTGGYHVAHCRACGFVYADTAAVQADYDAFYANRSKYEDPGNSTGSGESSFDRDRLGETARILAEFLPRRDARILDIGCAGGGLLEALRRRGYRNLAGIDPAAACARLTCQKGAEAWQGWLGKLPPDIGTFDAIVLSHVLEHVLDVATAMASLTPLLRAGGAVYIEVPDATRYADYVYSPFQDFNTEHINHFSGACLDRAAARHGLAAAGGGERLLNASPHTYTPAVYRVYRPADRPAEIAPDGELKPAILRYIERSSALLHRVDAAISRALESSPELIVWGAGQLTLKLLATTHLAQAKVAAFVDSNPIHHGRRLAGAPILAPAAIRSLPQPILISTLLHQRQIQQQIRELGLTHRVFLLPEANPFETHRPRRPDSRPQEQLAALLDESASRMQAREASQFDAAAYPHEGRMVLYGAGGLGRRTLRGLRSHGVEPLAFADRNPLAWGTAIDGIPVFSPAEAARRFGGDAVFVVAVWNPAVSGGIPEIAATLRLQGCRRVAPFVWLFWKYPQTFLPYYLWDLPSRILEDAAAVREALHLYHGARSQSIFLRHLELRLTGDFERLGPAEADPQYFPQHLFRPREDEHFVDCGAFDGDSLLAFADWNGGRFRHATAFEADPANLAALQRTVAADARLRGRVDCVPAAVGRRKSKLRFAASGLASAAASDAGEIEVDCLSLDEALGGEPATYLKMDIEGAEIDALLGASAALRHGPLVAACTYHTQDHLWRVPLCLRRLTPEGRLALRPYRVDGFDVVCYSIPPDRASSADEENREELCHSSAS